MIKSLARSVLVLLILFAMFGVTSSVFSQTYPFPAPTPAVAVTCNNGPLPLDSSVLVPNACPKGSQPLTPAYQLPIKAFVGRVVDSLWTPDYQCTYRTARAGAIAVSPDGKRIYFQMGSGVVAYSTDTFFTQQLGKPLTSIENLGSVLQQIPVRWCGFGLHGGYAERYLPWDKFSYFEAPGSGFDTSAKMDGQDRLAGYDVDDRGNVYSAAFIYGWGIAHDSGTSDGQLMSFVSQRTLANNDGQEATALFAVKTGGRYYAVVGSEGGSRAVVWDVTDATSPVEMGVRNIPLPHSIAHSALGDQLGLVTPDGKVAIYSANGYINGAAPIFTLTAAAGRSFGSAVATDGSNFYAVESGAGVPLRFHTLAPAGLTYSDTPFDSSEVGFTSLQPRYNSGLLTLTGSSGPQDIRVFRVISPTNFRNIDLNNYIRNYYFRAPSGAAFTSASASGKIFLSDALAYKHTNGKTYLILSALGLGDVYELQTADSIAASVKRFGETPNPNAPVASSTSPVYGDKVTFSGTASAATPFQVAWSFGNPETADNTNSLNLSNADITHQFGGLTAAGIASPKQVTVTSLLDPTITGTLPVQLRMPTVRIGLQGTGLPTTVFGASTPAAIVAGDSFVDASDGAVEGHFSSWSLDGVVTQGIPTAVTPVGACGAHAMSMTAHYGSYIATGPVLSTVPGIAGPVDFPLTVGPINYNAVPFLASISAPISSTDGSSVLFNGTLRATADTTAFVGAPAFTYHWDLMNATKTAAILSTPVVSAGPGGSIIQFVIPNATLAANSGSSPRLTVSVAAESLSTACAPFATNIALAGALNAPDPQVVATGCTATNIPCSLTATSVSGNDSDWLPNSYNWTIDGSAQAAHTKTITATLSESVGVPHSITVSVANAFTRGTSAALPVTTQRPACSGVPTTGNISVTFAGEHSACSSFSACTAGETVDFFVRSILVGGGGSGSVYPFNDACDKYTWVWGDGTPNSTTRNPVHTFAGSQSSYNVSMTIDGGNGSLTVPITVSFGVIQHDPPPPTCAAPSPINVGIVQLGFSSGCRAGTACNTGEIVNFDVAAQLGSFDFSCGNPQFSWNFGDGGTLPAKSGNHVFATSGTFVVTLQFSNSLGNITLTDTVIVSASSGPTSCGTDPSPNNTTVTYNQPSTAGCTDSNHAACAAGSAVTFGLQSLQYSLGTCYTFVWKFDDGSPDSTDRSPTHTFLGSKSSYAVTVAISGGPSGVATFHPTLSFGNSTPADPTPTISVSPDSPTVDQVVTFTHTNASSRAAKWSWDFGDGNTVSGTRKSVTNSYAAAGNYFVTLTVLDSTGATITSKVQTIVVTEVTRRRGAHH